MAPTSPAWARSTTLPRRAISAVLGMMPTAVPAMKARKGVDVSPSPMFTTTNGADGTMRTIMEVKNPLRPTNSDTVLIVPGRRLESQLAPRSRATREIGRGANEGGEEGKRETSDRAECGDANRDQQELRGGYERCGRECCNDDEQGPRAILGCLECLAQRTVLVDANDPSTDPEECRCQDDCEDNEEHTANEARIRIGNEGTELIHVRVLSGFAFGTPLSVVGAPGASACVCSTTSGHAGSPPQPGHADQVVNAYQRTGEVRVFRFAGLAGPVIHGT